jgi:hypothetical protein
MRPLSKQQDNVRCSYITQQHTCQVTARSARLECGWLALAYRTVVASWIERRPQTLPNITLLKDGRRGRWAEHVTRMRRKKILEPAGVTTWVILLHVAEYYCIGRYGHGAWN